MVMVKYSMTSTQLVWLNVWRRRKLYTTHPKDQYKYLGYVTGGMNIDGRTCRWAMKGIDGDRWERL